MRLQAIAGAFFGVFAAAPAALACPGMAASASCGTCSGLASAVSSVSLGVLVGVASVGIENVLRRRR